VGAGRLVREGSIAELRAGADGAGSVLVRSPEAARLAALLEAPGRRVDVEDPTRVVVTGATTDQVGAAAFAAGVELHELASRSSGLEQIYFQLTSGTEQYAAAPVGATQEVSR
jgi:ABC-2 type transport system ATP-binding protein